MSQEPPPAIEGVQVRRHLLVLVCFSFALGIVAGDRLALQPWLWAGLFLACVVGVFLGPVQQEDGSAFTLGGRREKAFLGFVLASCFFGGAAWHSLRAMPLPDDVSHFAGDQPAEIRGFVLERQVSSWGSLSLRVSAQHLRTLQEERPVSGVVIVYPRSPAEAVPGDQVRCVGRIQPPPAPSNWGEFSYGEYLREHGIHSVFYAESVDLVTPDLAGNASPDSLQQASNSLSLAASLQKAAAGWVGRAQESIHGRLAAALPARNRSLLSTLLSGILFGDRSYPLPQTVEDAFRRSGTIHVMVVSGTQVSLIAAFVLLLVRRSPLPIWAGSLLVVAFLSLYVLTVGGTPSVLRAGVMSLAAVTAMVLSRQLSIYNSLAFALLVLLLLNPASLFDVSLQLSFLATFGIVVLVPLIIRSTPSIPKIVSGTIAVTVGSQVMVAPALTYYFHRLPLVGFFANLVVVPCVAPLMALGIAMLAFSFFWPFAAALLGQVAAPLTEWMVWFVSAFSHWPGTGSGQAMLSPPEVWAFYVCLLALLSLLLAPVRKAITSQRAILAAAALAVIGGVWLVAKSAPQTLSITALDVDRGFCSVVQTPDGTSLIIDGGGPASERWNSGDTIILPFLLQQRVRKVGAILVTDLDHDHTAGLAPVLAQMPVRSLVLVGRGDASSSSDRMLHEAQQRGVEVFYSGANQRLTLGEDVRVTPGANPSLGTEGAYFLVLSYGNVDFIWATRADRLPLMNLVERRGRQVVLFLPVGTRLTPELERMLSTGSFPGVVLLPRTRFDTLDSQFRNLVYSRGVKVFRTDLDGAVKVTTDGQSVKFRTFGG